MITQIVADIIFLLSSDNSINCTLLQFLWFFSSVSCGIPPAQILFIVQTAAIHHSIFYSPLFLCLFNLESKTLLLSVPSVPSCSFLLSIFSIQFFSTLLSIPCSVFSLYLFALFSDLPYCFLFKSVILSFLFPITLFCLLLP